MKFENLNEVEAWKSGAFLGIGTHPAEIVSASEGKSSGGHDQFELEWAATDGPEKGSTIKEWIVVMESTKGKVVALLEACGVTIPPGEFNVGPEQLKGLKAAIVVRKEPDDKYPNVKGYLPISDLPADTTGMNSSASSADDKLPF